MAYEGYMIQRSNTGFDPDKKTHITASIIRNNKPALIIWIHLPFRFGLFQAEKPEIPSNGLEMARLLS